MLEATFSTLSLQKTFFRTDHALWSTCNKFKIRQKVWESPWLVIVVFKFSSSFKKNVTTQKTDATLYFQILLIFTLHSVYFWNLVTVFFIQKSARSVYLKVKSWEGVLIRGEHSFEVGAVLEYRNIIGVLIWFLNFQHRNKTRLDFVFLQNIGFITNTLTKRKTNAWKKQSLSSWKNEARNWSGCTNLLHSVHKG